MQRIRYLKTEEGTFVNKTPLISAGDLLKVTVNGLEYKIASSTKVLEEGLATNNFDLKKKIKKSLKGLGVTFLDEIRSKRTK